MGRNKTRQKDFEPGFDLMLGNQELKEQLENEIIAFRMFASRKDIENEKRGEKDGKIKKKRNINLPYEADISNYNINEFINRLIVNYYDTFNDKLKIIVKNLKEKIDSKETANIASIAYDILYDLYLSDDKANSFGIKADRIAIRLNTKEYGSGTNAMKVIKKMKKDLGDPGSPKIVKTMLISYFNLPIFEREKIIFKQEYKMLNDAIKNNSLVSCKYLNAEYKNNETQMLPLIIDKSKYNTGYYIRSVYQRRKDGKYLENNNGNPEMLDNTNAMHLYGFDISNMITLKNDCKHNINLEELKNKIRENSIEFASEKSIEYKVKFNEEGLNRFNHLVRERPNSYIPDENNNFIYKFNCTKFQLRNYLYPFKNDKGEDLAEVLNSKDFWGE